MYENPAWNKPRSNGGLSFFRSILSAVPAFGATRDRFVEDLGGLIPWLRNSPGKQVAAARKFAAPVRQKQPSLVLDLSQPDRYVFAFRGLDDVQQFIAWHELRRELTVFAWLGRPVAVIEPVPKDSMSTRIRKELAQALGSTVVPYKIEVEVISWRIAKVKKVVAKDVVTFVPTASRDLLLETAEDSAYLSYGTLILADLADGDVEAAKELVRRCRLSEWSHAEMPAVDRESLVCAPGGNQVIWSKPSKSVEEISRFLRERAAACGWAFEVEGRLAA
ncbi:hypothetical protein [Vulgatibacter incomptus]|uniref:Uncharacterized protein n=1 Tax=Vulgatibacter incomptus TaxID=1391653 RepID=A0A0K1PBR2_9BACT|nr:hypothetical protein [Vulgatibacter incomptus]AKU90937.1 hypothetical protein AKJ08_1324 [Vulgatibacter incomptus]